MVPSPYIESRIGSSVRMFPAIPFSNVYVYYTTVPTAWCINIFFSVSCVLWLTSKDMAKKLACDLGDHKGIV